MMQWFTLVGLVVDAIGAIILAKGLFLTEDEAIQIGLSRFAGNTREENLQLTGVKALLRQSKDAKRGLVWLLVGFGLQFIGSWPR